MGIELHVEPRKVYTWEQFKAEKPPFSIALDGIVSDSTQRDVKGPYANFDHHANVDRLSTRSTSAQVFFEINMGLFNTFKKDGKPEANVYVNDPDEDVCLAFWLLNNHEQVLNHANPRINRLVECEDKLDSTSGAYPFGNIYMRRRMAWIFEPYNAARFTRQLPNMDSSGMKNVIEAVNARINNHIFDMGGELSLEGNYELIGGGEEWKLVMEKGPASRLAMYHDGIKAYASLISGNDTGTYMYSLGRKSIWVPFDIPKIYNILNYEERDIVTPSNKWGGSDITGGSPKETGSKLHPLKLQELINSTIE